MPRPVVTTISSPETLLALLPVLAGLTPVDSVVIAPFVRGRAMGAFRVDQPSSDVDDAGLAAYASHLLGMVAKVDDCDLVAIVLYTSDVWLDAGPRRDLVAAVRDRFAAEGFAIADDLCVAADGWGRLVGDDPLQPLESIAAASREWAAAHPDVPVGPTLPALPDRDDLLAARVAMAFADLCDGVEVSAFGVVTLAVLPEPIAFLESLLQSDAPPATPTQLARLIALIEREGDIDRTVLQIAFGRKVAVASWRGTLAARAGAARDGVTPTEWMLRGGRGTQRRASRSADLLMGMSSRIPLRERLGRGADLIARAAVHAPRGRRAPLLCALAWLLWSLGRSSLAAETLETADAEDPGYEMTAVLSTVFRLVPLPQWLYSRLQDVA